MSEPLTVRKEIVINAPASKVWGMFIDPVFTRQMGGRYISNWQVGSSFRWQALNGSILTNGMILDIEPEKFLQHSLYYPEEEDEVMARITYTLDEEDGKTVLAITEEFTDPITEKDHEDSMDGWSAALTMIKQLMENK
ncbi:MAG: SRPBCC domain-containing protein [Sediminibacterium sp.]